MRTPIPIGRVACVSRGAYDPATEYEALDIITHEGCSYLVTADCNGQAPPNGECYMQLAAIGSQGSQGIQGEKGDTGTGLQIKGKYTTIAALQAAVSSPAVGDMYNVGASAPFNIYMWNGAAWEDQGQLQGAQGPAGPGVPASGTTGQVLQKKSDTNYDTEWADPPSGSVQTVNGVDPVDGEVTLAPSDIGTAPALQSDVTYYVATTGNDTTGDGTSGNPFATVNKALSMIPANLNGYTATINVAAGEYAQGFGINGYYGGTLNIIGAFTTANVPGVTFKSRNGERYRCSACAATVCLKYFKIDTTYARGLEVAYMAALTLEGIHLVDSHASPTAWLLSCGNSSVYVPYTSTEWRVECSNGKHGIRVSGGMYACNMPVGGSGNDIGIICGPGIAQLPAPNAGFATTLYSTANGGRIFAGAQTSAPNY